MSTNAGDESSKITGTTDTLDPRLGSSSDLTLSSSTGRKDDVDGQRQGRTAAGRNKAKAGKRESKKRKRSGEDRSSDPLALQQERYDRLFYTAHKKLYKQAKQVKTFLVQKAIRKQKQRSDNNISTSSSSHDDDSSNQAIRRLKDLDLEVVTQQALRQLGLYHSNPRLKLLLGIPKSRHEEGGDSDSGQLEDQRQEEAAEKEQEQTSDLLSQIPAPLCSEDADYSYVNSILTHKRFLQTLEEWNGKVAEYRRWCLEIVDGKDNHSSEARTGKRKQATAGSSSKNHLSSLQSTAEEPSSMFCTLDGAIGEEDAVPQKKNRKGQRARKAKAMAIQAQREGRKDYTSVNWRAPKTNQNSQAENEEKTSYRESNSGSFTRQKNCSSMHKIQPREGKNIGTERSTQNASTEAEHPSWAARQAQKTGIVAFQGKKITFD